MKPFRKLVLVPAENIGRRYSIPSYDDADADERNKKQFLTTFRTKSLSGTKSSDDSLIITQLLGIGKKDKRAQALSLYSKLKKIPFIQWDQWGNVSLYGTPLTGTTIDALLHYAVHPYVGKRKMPAPPFWKDFANLLERIPQLGSGYKQRRCPKCQNERFVR